MEQQILISLSQEEVEVEEDRRAVQPVDQAALVVEYIWAYIHRQLGRKPL
jgi:hypothetical protein